MAETRRLYYDDAYLLEFEAAIVERRVHEGRPAVVLDATAFYPESGGQPWDKGTLGGVEVLEVVDLDGAILHVLASRAPGGDRARPDRRGAAGRPQAAAHGPARPVAGLLGAAQGRNAVVPHGPRDLDPRDRPEEHQRRRRATGSRTGPTPSSGRTARSRRTSCPTTGSARCRCASRPRSRGSSASSRSTASTIRPAAERTSGGPARSGSSSSGRPRRSGATSASISCAGGGPCGITGPRTGRPAGCPAAFSCAAARASTARSKSSRPSTRP